jgi:GNAT superfamily N-acetyltransferase
MVLAPQGATVTLPFEMKFLNSGSLADLLELQEVIAANLPCPEIFMMHDDLYLREILRHERSVIGATTEEGLIAFSIIRIPGLSCENLGRDISLPEEELTKVAHLQAAAVHPAHRGQGLQRKLIFAHLAVIEEIGYDHACCTVSPKNPVSLRNYLSCGLAIEWLCPKKHGWWRFILHKKIKRRGSANPQKADDMQNDVNMHESSAQIAVSRISISDIEGQLDLIKRGFKGFRVATHPEGAQIFYGKF